MQQEVANAPSGQVPERLPFGAFGHSYALKINYGVCCVRVGRGAVQPLNHSGAAKVAIVPRVQF